MAALPGQAKHRGAEAYFPLNEVPLSKSDSNARWSVTCYASCYIESLAIVRKLHEFVIDVQAPTTEMPFSPVVSDEDSGGDEDSDGEEDSDADEDLDADEDSDTDVNN